MSDENIYNMNENKTPDTENPSYEEIDDIREDLRSLKNHVFELTRHARYDAESNLEENYENLKHGTEEQFRKWKHDAEDGLNDLRNKGYAYYYDAERTVIDKPFKSLLTAIAAGALFSLFLNSRRW